MLIVVGREEKGVGPHLVILLGSVLGSELRSGPLGAEEPFAVLGFELTSGPIPPATHLVSSETLGKESEERNMSQGPWWGGVCC